MAWANLRGKAVTVCFRLASQIPMRFANTSRRSLSTTRNGISRTSFANFAKNIMSPWMNDMCGTDFVTPFQGLELFDYAVSRGVAPGCLVARFQRVDGETFVQRKNSRC